MPHIWHADDSLRDLDMIMFMLTHRF